MNPKNPMHVVKRWRFGFAIELRKDMRAKRARKVKVETMPMPTKTGVAEGGVLMRTAGAFEGRAETSGRVFMSHYDSSASSWTYHRRG